MNGLIAVVFWLALLGGAAVVVYRVGTLPGRLGRASAAVQRRQADKAAGKPVAPINLLAVAGVVLAIAGIIVARTASAIFGLGIMVVGLGLILIGSQMAKAQRNRSGQGGYAQQPSGWYPDPSGQAIQRFFDGLNWTDHTHALPDSLNADHSGPPRSNPPPEWQRGEVQMPQSALPFSPAQMPPSDPTGHTPTPHAAVAPTPATTTAGPVTNWERIVDTEPRGSTGSPLPAHGEHPTPPRAGHRSHTSLSSDASFWRRWWSRPRILFPAALAIAAVVVMIVVLSTGRPEKSWLDGTPSPVAEGTIGGKPFTINGVVRCWTNKDDGKRFVEADTGSTAPDNLRSNLLVAVPKNSTTPSTASFSSHGTGAVSVVDPGGMTVTIVGSIWQISGQGEDGSLDVTVTCPSEADLGTA